MREFLHRNHFDIGEAKMTISERVNTTVKYSYHIVYHIVMPLTLIERIASRMQKSFPSVDLQVYTTKSLRINGSLKFNKGQKTFDITSLITSQDEFKHTLVSYTYGYPEVNEPIALSKSNILNFTHQASKVTASGDMPKEYMDVLDCLLVEDESQDKPFKVASVKTGRLCPCCLKIHSTNNDKTIHFY